jgi:hypothetical protein
MKTFAPSKVFLWGVIMYFFNHQEYSHIGKFNYKKRTDRKLNIYKSRIKTCMVFYYALLLRR